MLNKPSKDFLMRNAYRYYYFTLTDDSVVNYVGFQMTHISGEAWVFISRTNPRPTDWADSERALIMDDRVTFSKAQYPTLSGKYYIGVYAESAAYYSLTAFVGYQDHISKNTVTKLFDGVTQKIQSQKSNPMFFLISRSESEASSFSVHVKETSQQFQLCVRNDKTKPDGNNCFWKSTNNSLTIRPSDESYGNGTNFVIEVSPQKGADGQYQDHYFYSIYYISNNTVMNIGDTKTHSDYLTEEKKEAWYQFVIDKDNDDWV
mmetsp:Transcript_23308/g.20196  ORF Transcript_23308/g.20196 Transcript_23308/m.20196 type:complete len:261 (+) Transcript_23308:515-1297(+)